VPLIMHGATSPSLGLSTHRVNRQLYTSAVLVLVLDFPAAGLVPLDLLKIRKVIALLERLEDARQWGRLPPWWESPGMFNNYERGSTYDGDQSGWHNDLHSIRRLQRSEHKSVPGQRQTLPSSN
jgi:hypothetical protein